MNGRMDQTTLSDGQLASCKPISEPDLAKYMAECIRDTSLENKARIVHTHSFVRSSLEL